MQLRQCLFLFFLMVLLSVQGCIAHQHEMGRPLGLGQVDQIVEGKTTEAEAVALLGQPQRVMERPDGSKIIVYSHHLTQIYGQPGLSNTKGGVSSETLMLGIRNGIVMKKWQSSTNLPTTMRTGQTFSVPDQFK